MANQQYPPIIILWLFKCFLIKGSFWSVSVGFSTGCVQYMYVLFEASCVLAIPDITIPEVETESGRTHHVLFIAFIHFHPRNLNKPSKIENPECSAHTMAIKLNLKLERYSVTHTD